MVKSNLKVNSLTVKVGLILAILSAREESGIPGVAVKCVDIRRNTGGEGGFLARN